MEEANNNDIVVVSGDSLDSVGKLNDAAYLRHLAACQVKSRTEAFRALVAQELLARSAYGAVDLLEPAAGILDRTSGKPWDPIRKTMDELNSRLEAMGAVELLSQLNSEDEGRDGDRVIIVKATEMGDLQMSQAAMRGKLDPEQKVVALNHYRRAVNIAEKHRARNVFLGLRKSLGTVLTQIDRVVELMSLVLRRKAQ